MTAGQFLFCSGIGLLILTIILGVIFWVKKPKYVPENAAFDSNGDPHTHKLRSGYPTDRLTIRREPVRPKEPDTVLLQEGTERLTAERSYPDPETEVLTGAGDIKEQRTEKLRAGTVPLSKEMMPLAQSEETAPHCAPPASAGGETAVLDSSEETDATEKLSGTTPLSGE